ncbi:MAG: alpha/beta hydrolase [Nostoc sp.]|uniref:alpha/beta hydrolase n=1 Tax=Nostoc sp. TaxID=1180 RepID=UPI002FF4DF27
MKHLVILPLLISAIGATTAAVALDKTRTSHKNSQAPAQKSSVVEGADNFYKSDKAIAQKVTFKNQYNMQVVGTLFIPKTLNQTAKNPAIIVGHPMGAVKEQSANLYAQKLADQGFVTLSLDLSFWGESEGRTRNAVSPDIYAEDFSAAVDFLGTRPFVDKNRIGVLGICGSGSFVISAAKIDPRMKAIATVSMYDMGAANRNGLRHSTTLEQRKKAIAEAAEQRYVEFTGGETEYTGGTVHELNENSTAIEREFYDFYRTPRGEYTSIGSSLEQEGGGRRHCRARQSGNSALNRRARRASDCYFTGACSNT